jgi:hypothetical protein
MGFVCSGGEKEFEGKVSPNSFLAALGLRKRHSFSTDSVRR